jgi:predicted dehydrogenase
VEFDVLTGRVAWTARGVQTEVQDAHPSPGFAEEADHFLQCVRRGSTPLTSITDQIATLRVVYAAYEAAAGGRAVKLPPEDP